MSVPGRPSILFQISKLTGRRPAVFAAGAELIFFFCLFGEVAILPSSLRKPPRCVLKYHLKELSVSNAITQTVYLSIRGRSERLKLHV